MSTTPGVNATAPKAATAAGSAAVRAEDGPQEAAGFAALLSSAEAEALPLPATEAAPKLPAEADATRADAALPQPLPLFGVPWPAVPAGPAGQAAELAPAAPQGPRLAGMTARLQAQEAAAATGTPAPESTPQDAAPSTEPLLQQAELARRAAQQRAKALAAGSEAAEPQQARTRQPALQPQQQAQTLAVASAQAGGAAGPTALAAAWLAGGSEAARSWRAREDKTTATTGVPLLAGVDSSQAGAGASAAAGASSALPVPAAAPDAALLTSQRVAEQLSYWVRRGVHNAELELDGPGDEAVQVHIALQGQQARVEFRADLAPTRQLLEDAAPHLRELLAREGLVLANVSVGAYGGERGGQAGGGNPDGRGSARRTLVVEVPAATPAASARVSAAGGRTLDLYV